MLIPAGCRTLKSMCNACSDRRAVLDDAEFDTAQSEDQVTIMLFSG